MHISPSDNVWPETHRRLTFHCSSLQQIFRSHSAMPQVGSRSSPIKPEMHQASFSSARSSNRWRRPTILNTTRHHGRAHCVFLQPCLSLVCATSSCRSFYPLLPTYPWSFTSWHFSQQRSSYGLLLRIHQLKLLYSTSSTAGVGPT